jgi:adhesin HecA-like repeat protein
VKPGYKSAILVGFAIALIANAPAARVHAASTIWGIYPSGTITQPGIVGSTFDDTCWLVGVASGTSGGCNMTLRIKSAVANFTCLMTMQVTGWTTTKLTNSQGFLVTSGVVEASAPTSTEAAFCVYISFPVGTVNPYTGVFIAPVDTQIPAMPGTYHVNGYGHVLADGQVTVTVDS